MKKRNFGWLAILLLQVWSLQVAAEDTATTNSEVGKESTGKVVSASRTLPSFNAISLSGVGKLYIKQSREQNFTVEAEDKLLPAVVVYVKDSTLFIDLKDDSATNRSKLNYYLSIKELQKIEAFSNSSIFMNQGVFKGKSLTIALNGFGEANIKVNVDKLVAQLAGGSKLEAEGSADAQEITIKGAGEFTGSKLEGQEGSISIDGSGSAKTRVSDKLSVKVAGEGEVKYCEKPTINRDITGKGTVSPLTDKECKI